MTYNKGEVGENMINREYIKKQIDTLPEETVARIDEIINSGKSVHSISDYNKKTQKAIRKSHKIPRKSEKFKTAEELFKDLGI
jgi:hypoxanthine phosphoribosyltransferase